MRRTECEILGTLSTIGFLDPHEHWRFHSFAWCKYSSEKPRTRTKTAPTVLARISFAIAAGITIKSSGIAAVGMDWSFTTLVSFSQLFRDLRLLALAGSDGAMLVVLFG
jgi:hypothetical protein